MLLLQAATAFLAPAVEAHAARISHAIVHEQALGHQHYNDATLTLQAEQPNHQHVLDGVQHPALLVGAGPIQAAIPTSAVQASEPLQPPSAHWPPLLRPPQRLIV